MTKEYIDREEVVKILNRRSYVANEPPMDISDNAIVKELYSIKEEIRNILSVDVVEVQHGEWETVNGVFTPGGDPLKRCPFCKSKESEHLDGIEFPNNWLYCPKCGAKMDRKAEEEHEAD